MQLCYFNLFYFISFVMIGLQSISAIYSLGVGEGSKGSTHSCPTRRMFVLLKNKQLLLHVLYQPCNVIITFCIYIDIFNVDVLSLVKPMYVC
jgi:hypothetical protein